MPLFAGDPSALLSPEALRRELGQAQDLLSATDRVVHALGRSTSDFSDVFDRVVESARRLCRADAVQLFLAEAGGFRLAWHVGVSEEYAAFVEARPLGSGRGSLVGRVAVTRHTEQIKDVLADPHYAQREAQALGGFRTIIGAPMVVTGRVVGVLSVWRARVDPFSQREANLLTSFADQAAVAVRTVELVRALEARSAEAAAHARSERLLMNVLPVQIADRLKDREEVIADRFEGASVLFADIVGFTGLSARLPPEQVVRLLDGLFSRLDQLVDEFELEKIKTIGDAYMVAAGIPVPRADHAHVLARFALAAREDLATRNLTSDTPVQLRVGISSGPVVAGVIGRRRFLYDLWGDTVNTASRMESHGIPGRIQITDATRALLGEQFECTDRGVIDVKGKGPTHTWILQDERAPADGAEPVLPVNDPARPPQTRSNT
jgi:class 3 adenylate cyclase